MIHSSKANESAQIELEVDGAVTKGFAVVLFRIEDVSLSRTLEYSISGRQWLDAFTPPLERHLADLTHLVSLRESRPAAAEMADLAAPPDVDDVERPGTPEMPAGVTDLVRFSVTAPPALAPGAHFLIDAWAHLERHRDEVLRRARQAARTDEILFREKGPVRIARGGVLTVCLHPIDGFEIEDREDTIFWEGEIGNASFPVAVSTGAAPGPRRGTVSFFLANLAIAKLHFVLEVGARSTAAADLPAEVKRYRTAFASYASEDRDEVLRVVQGLQKGAPYLEVFLDVVDLRSGQRWEEELWRA